MIDSLSLVVTLTCVVAALAVAATTAAGRFRPGRFAGVLVVVEGALVGQALLAVVSLARGHRLAETATFVAYLVFSLVILPVAASQVRGDNGRWSAAVLAVALVVQAVVVVRMQTTWRQA